MEDQTRFTLRLHGYIRLTSKGLTQLFFFFFFFLLPPKKTIIALVITVDTPFLGRRLADVRNVFKLPSHMSMANFETKDSKVTMANILDQPNKQDAAAEKLLERNQGSNGAEKAAQGRNTKVVKQESSLAAYVVSQIDPTLNWKDIEWIRSITKLPIVVKGVMTAEDAKLAADAGCQGILVSNHGGRQLDGVLATVCTSLYLSPLPPP